MPWRSFLQFARVFGGIEFVDVLLEGTGSVTSVFDRTDLPDPVETHPQGATRPAATTMASVPSICLVFNMIASRLLREARTTQRPYAYRMLRS